MKLLKNNNHHVFCIYQIAVRTRLNRSIGGIKQVKDKQNSFSALGADACPLKPLLMADGRVQMN